MDRREAIVVLATGATGASGCLEPTITERPTGEIDIVFETEATRDYLIKFELIDAGGNIVDEFESGFPPDQEGAPSFYAGGLSNGPYTATIETEAERETFEWSIADCPRLDVVVTVRVDGQLEINRTCSSA